MIIKRIIFIYIFLLFIFNANAIIPKDCIKIVDEIIKYSPYIKDLMVKEICTCGKPIPFTKAKPYIDEAIKKLANTIVPYIHAKVPKTPKDITPNWIIEIASSIEVHLKNHKDLCKFDLKNPSDKKEIDKMKSTAIEKTLPKAIGMLPMASECKKAIGIATLILHDIPLGKINSSIPINIRSLIHEMGSKLCKSL